MHQRRRVVLPISVQGERYWVPEIKDDARRESKPSPTSVEGRGALHPLLDWLVDEQWMQEAETQEQTDEWERGTKT